MKVLYSIAILSVLVTLSIGDREKSEHGAHAAHYKEDGEHNPHFDHEAIIGSRKEEEEFDELPPEEAKKRLGILAIKMDLNSDNIITEEELVQWILNSFKRLDEEDAVEQMKEQDRDEDNFITWEEYSNSQGYNTATDDEDEKESFRVMKEEDEIRFKAADLNQDGKLDKDEYLAFSQPHNYEHMHGAEIRIKLNTADKDKDGFISKEEFFSETMGDENEKERFDEYDTNKDGKLDKDEMKPWILADNHEAAVEEARHLIGQGDVDKDGSLSIQEIMDHHEEFVGSTATDYGSDLHLIKDEL